MAIELAVLAATAVIALGGAIVQTVTGFGFALVAVPALMLLLPVREAVVVASLLGLGNAALVALSTRGHADRRTVLRLLLGTVAGMPLGLAFLLALPPDAIRAAVGIVTVSMAVAVARGYSLAVRGGRTDVGIGLACGVLATSCGMNGPPVVLYLQSRGLGPQAFRATLSRFFLVSGLLSQVAFGLTGVLGGRAILVAAAGVPAALVGHRLGAAVAARIPPRLFRSVVLALLASAAALGTFTALARIYAPTPDLPASSASERASPPAASGS
jgi:uncharacterized membrane protein YfcA